MTTIEGRYIPCPECGDERGKGPIGCLLCDQYDPERRKQKPKEEAYPPIKLAPQGRQTSLERVREINRGLREQFAKRRSEEKIISEPRVAAARKKREDALAALNPYNGRIIPDDENKTAS